jgi:uncharacterized protein (UPF0332 family)
MTLTLEERKAVVETRLGKALRAYGEAKGVLTLGYWETIANRLYYAAYDAVSALLIATGDNPHTHSGVIHLWGQKFVTTGLVSSETGQLYHRLFSLRQTGDYDDSYSLSEADVAPYVEPTGKLIDEVASLARKFCES